MYAATWHEAREANPRASITVWNTGTDGGVPGPVSGMVPDDWDGTRIYVVAPSKYARCNCCGHLSYRPLG